MRLVAVLCAAVTLSAFAPSRAADDKDAKAMQGAWVYESMEWNGKKIPADQIKESIIVIEGDKFAIKRGKDVIQGGTIKFDAAKAQKTFDATVTEGEGKGTVMLGIYKLDGGTATVCLNYSGKKRPADFKTDELSEAVLVVAKRKK